MTGYLLADQHPVGGAKARLFQLHGYSLQHADVLKRELLRIALQGRVVEREASTYGTKYVVDGTISTPNKTLLTVRTVWIIEQDQRPRLVTAYPAPT